MKLLKNAVVAMVAISISLVILNADQDSAETHVWTKKGTTFVTVEGQKNLDVNKWRKD